MKQVTRTRTTNSLNGVVPSVRFIWQSENVRHPSEGQLVKFSSSSCRAGLKQLSVLSSTRLHLLKWTQCSDSKWNASFSHRHECECVGDKLISTSTVCASYWTVTSSRTSFLSFINRSLFFILECVLYLHHRRKEFLRLRVGMQPQIPPVISSSAWWTCPSPWSERTCRRRCRCRSAGGL